VVAFALVERWKPMSRTSCTVVVESGFDAALMIWDSKETSSVLQAAVNAPLIFMVFVGSKSMISGL
jgi:hypothetical protein